MKRIILTTLLLISIFASTKAVIYYGVGSNAEFCVYQFDGEYCLILNFKDDGENRIWERTIVKFKLTNGQIITLYGFEGSKKTKMHSTNWGFGISSGSSSDKHYVILNISQEEIEQLNIGVDKVAINTIPEVYERNTWTGKKDFGQKLYKEFKNMKNEFDE